MNAEKLAQIIGADFYTGVPDSQLKALCDYLMHTYGIDPRHHIIAANEGGCAAIAAGYYLSTGRVPVVYMQNSGQGNVINPAASLLNEQVYAIPMLFIVGWRGEPGIHDEPQHVFQGEITLKLLEDLGIPAFVIDSDTTEQAVAEAMNGFRDILTAGGQAAFVIRKNALSFGGKVCYKNDYLMTREEIIRHIVRVSGEDPVVSTTGKASRELFEIREAAGRGHQYDFLTVGSMGHSSSIALGIAIQKPGVKVWCLDGDGAMLMHMGAAAVIGAAAPENLVHVVINNGAHETVGGMPTVAKNADLVGIAKSCGYPRAVRVRTFEELDEALLSAKAGRLLTFIEVKAAIGARSDLGRPTTAPQENKAGFMAYLKSR